MISQASFAIIFRQQFAGYLRTAINWLKRAMVLYVPAPTTAAKLLGWFVWEEKFVQKS